MDQIVVREGSHQQAQSPARPLQPQQSKEPGDKDGSDGWDEDSNIKGRGLHPRLTKKSLKWYKKIFKDAATDDSDRYMFFIKKFGEHRDLPVGKVSGKTYQQLVQARQFDEFCRMVYKREETRQEAITRMTSTLIADDDDHEAQRALDKKKLLTPIWRIGYKRELHAPVGSRKHQNNVLNSEGNEVFFSYNGDWKDGKMHGSGIYQFADGHRCEGLFHEGWMHGPCTVTYPNGAVYQGSFKNGKFEGEGELVMKDGCKYTGLWKNGKRHGLGKIEYSSGMRYEGEFYVGKPHGRGKIFSPTTNYTFEGSFEEGVIHGYGTLIDPEGVKEAGFWGGLSTDRSFTDTIEQVHKAKIADFKRKLREDDEKYAFLRALRLKEFVSSLKQQIAQDRYDHKRDKMLSKRKKAKELMDKLKSKYSSSESFSSSGPNTMTITTASQGPSTDGTLMIEGEGSAEAPLIEGENPLLAIEGEPSNSDGGQQLIEVE